ncbi:MAG TPA: GIY-YIG nuclease family protein [Tepidisphaeraceae bacterium]|nr:GIY-YIG nuclease family protein [Tepidisphaeraceae bacterium]
MNRLIEIGFEQVGDWSLENGTLKFVLKSCHQKSNVLYAFISDGVVKYVGKTTQTLNARMSAYKTPGSKSQSTNIRNRGNIVALLEQSYQVTIWALPDNGLIHYGRFHFNLAAGLEDSLIKTIRPDWNIRKEKDLSVTPLEETKEGILFKESEPSLPKEMLVENQPISAVTTFPVIVHSAYYNGGFFNVGVAYAKNFGNDGEKIEISFSDGSEPIVGVIDRRANSNQTPRIRGFARLKKWFQDHLSEKDEVSVHVISPTAIRLDKQLNGSVA